MGCNGPLPAPICLSLLGAVCRVVPWALGLRSWASGPSPPYSQPDPGPRLRVAAARSAAVGTGVRTGGFSAARCTSGLRGTTHGHHPHPLTRCRSFCPRPMWSLSGPVLLATGDCGVCVRCGTQVSRIWSTVPVKKGDKTHPHSSSTRRRGGPGGPSATARPPRRCRAAPSYRTAPRP